MEQDIQQLYEDAMTILNDPRGLDEYQKSFLEGYFSAMYDEIHELIEPNTDITDEDFIDFIECIWQRKNAIVEDDQLRRRFCLLCQKVVQVFNWNE